MYCGIQLYMCYVLWGHSYTCSMYCGDTVIHVVCIIGDTVIYM